MKFGAHIYLWISRWSDSQLPLLHHARDLGLDFVEIAIGDDVVFDPALTSREASSLGLELVAGPGGDWPMEADISLPSTECQQLGLTWHRRAIATAADLGAVAYAGAIYGHPGHVERRLPTADEYACVAEHLHALASYAAEVGIVLALEPMSHFRTHLVNRPEQLMQLIELADHPALRVLIDTYHLVTETRDYHAAIRAAAPRLWGLHACESDRGAPGGGLVPWNQVASALQGIQFNGYIALESYRSGPEGFAHERGLYGDVCPDPDQFVQHGLAFLRPLLIHTEAGQSV